MSTAVTFNGVSYTVPAIADASWATNVSSYLIAISTGCLQKTGGTFTLTAEVNLGATYGVKSAYLKSQTANIAAAGVLLLAKTDTINWRNNANGADLALGINGSDLVTFNSIALANISTAQTLTNKSMDGGSNTFTNLPTTGLAGLVAPANGGTGVANNAASTLTISGSFASTFTVTGATGVTFPTTGTLATRAGSETLTNKTLTGNTAVNLISGSGTLTLNTSGTATVPNATDTLVGKATTDTLTNKTISGASNTLTVRAASDITGQLPVANGGTGASTANLGLNALLPSQTSNSGKVLSTNGTDTSWAAALTTTLSSTHIFVGNGSNVATDVALSGQGTLSNTGALTLTNASTGVAGAVSATTQTMTGIKTFETQLIGKGTATNDSAAAGYIGEYISQSNSAGLTGTTSATWANANTGMSLTAGDWDISAVLQVARAGTNATTNISIMIGTTSSASTGILNGDNCAVSASAPTAAADSTVSIPSFRVSLSGTTTYFLNYNITYTSTAPGYYYRISARRVR